MRSLLMSRRVTIALTLLFACLVVACTGSGSGPSKRSDDSDKPSKHKVTITDYNQIQDGMSYAQVEKIIGSAGEELASGHVDGVQGVTPAITTRIVMWKNDNGSNMNATFQNDRLVSKAQFGLPTKSSAAIKQAEQSKAEADATRKKAEQEAKAAVAEKAAELNAANYVAQAKKAIGEGNFVYAKERLQRAVRDYPQTDGGKEAKRILDSKSIEEAEKRTDDARAAAEAASKLAAAEERARSFLKYAQKLAADGSDIPKARVRLQEIIKDFPGTESAKEAKLLLESLK